MLLILPRSCKAKILQFGSQKTLQNLQPRPDPTGVFLKLQPRSPTVPVLFESSSRLEIRFRLVWALRLVSEDWGSGGADVWLGSRSEVMDVF